MIQFTNDAQNYYHYRVKNIDPGIGAPRAPPEAPLGALVVVPAIPKGKKYGGVIPTEIYVNNIQYSYLVLP